MTCELMAELACHFVIANSPIVHNIFSRLILFDQLKIENYSVKCKPLLSLTGVFESYLMKMIFSLAIFLTAFLI